MSFPAIEWHGVSKSFGDLQVLNDVSASINDGEAVALLGCNGAGKSTLVRMVLGLLPPDQGQIRLWGGRPSTSTRSRIGYLPEDCGLYDRMKVDETITFFAGIHGLSKSEGAQRAGPLLEAMGLQQRLTSRIHTLSKGNQQKVKLICALLHQPELLIFDEPFSGLDVEGTRLLGQALTDCKEQGITLLLSSHRLDQMEILADRALILHHGSFHLDQPMRELDSKTGLTVYEVETRLPVDPPSPLPKELSGLRGEQCKWWVTLSEGTTPDQALLVIQSWQWPIHSFAPRRTSLEETYVEVTGTKAEIGASS